MSLSPSRIYLTGFMGSGKSTTGPLLARALGFAFADLDTVIEEHAGRTVREIFQVEGQGVFRALEAASLRETARSDRIVVAVGGGAFTQADNLEFALAHGTVVYLRVPVEELVDRLEPTAATRPLLCGDDGLPVERAALRERVASMVQSREPFYARAHVTVDIERLSEFETVQAVLQALRGAVEPGG